MRFGKAPEYVAIAGPRKNGREVAKTIALSTGKKQKNYSCKLRRKIKKDSSNFKSKF